VLDISKVAKLGMRKISFSDAQKEPRTQKSLFLFLFTKCGSSSDPHFFEQTSQNRHLSAI